MCRSTTLSDPLEVQRDTELSDEEGDLGLVTVVLRQGNRQNRVSCLLHSSPGVSNYFL